MHIDMDHFYTAIEEREHPEYKGNPVVVGADPKQGKGRGVVSTSNYEARKLGIKSGIPISRAWRLCQKAIYLPPNFPLYIETSTRIMEIVRKHAGKFEQWGIDEAFLDITTKVRNYAEAVTLAKRLKNAINEKEHLTCSIGIGPNKLVSKIASDYQKPNGLTIVREGEAREFLAPLPVRRLLWVGRKTEAKLKTLDIKTIGDLTSADPAFLSSVFGSMGTQMHLMARGVDRSEVEYKKTVKSISRETTFEEDTAKANIVNEALDTLSEEVCQQACTQNLFFKTVTVKVRYENFETHTHTKTLQYMTNRVQDLKKIAKDLLVTYIGHNRKIRLIGVRISSFVEGKKQKTLA